MRHKSLEEFGLPVELAEPHAPVVLFDKVDLAFDEKVILKNVTFSVRAGHTKIFLGASGAGKSTILKLMLGLLRPDAGTIWVLGHRVDEMTETQLMGVRHHMGMVFQEGALFDSFTVGENVGYKLYEETTLPLDVGPRPGRGSARLRRPERAHRQAAVGAVGRAAPPRRDRPRHGGQAHACCCTTNRPPVSIRSPSLTIDAEIIKLRDLENVTSVLVTHQLRDAYYIAEHSARRGGDHELEICARRRRQGRAGRLRDVEGRRHSLRRIGRRIASVDRPVPERRFFRKRTYPPCRAPVHSPGPNSSSA